MPYHDFKFFHNIFLNKEMNTPAILPETLVTRKEEARIIYPEAEYCLWDGEKCRDLIRNNFDSDVLHTFDDLIPYAYKADLARYCILYQFGGIYADLSISLQNRWLIPLSYKVAAFTQSYDDMHLWLNTMQSVLWSTPRQYEWELAIRKIVEHCRDKYYGPNSHYPTGPALIGYCFAKAMLERDNKEDQQFMGVVRFNPLEKTPATAHFITPLRTLVATKKDKETGSLHQLGLKTGNHYPQLWSAKKIYGETISTWHFSEEMFQKPEHIKRSKKGIHVAKHDKGVICYGPYIQVEKQKYKFKLNLIRDSYLPGWIIIEVAHSSQHRLYRRTRRCIIGLSKKHSINFTVNFRERLEYVEFRIKASRSFSGVLIDSSLTPL